MLIRFASLLLVLVLALAALDAHAADLAGQRAAFKKAYAAIEAGELSTAADQLDALADYPLYPYLRYAILDHALDEGFDATPPQAVADFLAEYPDLPIDAALRYRWLRALAQNHDWVAFLTYYDGDNAAALVCASVSAGLLDPNADQTAARRDELVAHAKSLWLSAHDQPRECNPAFAWLTAQGLLPEDLIRARFEKALDAHHFNLASYLADKLSPADQQRVARWQAMAADPASALAAPPAADTPETRARLVYGLGRLARDNAAEAKLRWQALAGQYRFNARDRATVARDVALWEARQHLPDAYRDLAALPASGYGLVKQWRIRTALWRGWWHTALKDIYNLPSAYRHSDQWQYWRARALAETHHEDEATAIYRRLARGDGYYSFLAADRIGASYAFSPRPSEPNAARMQALAKGPQLIRAHELFAVGMLNFADAEWNAATGDMPVNDRCQAGLLAASWQWHAAAIRTLARGGCWDDLKLRYPTAYEDAVETRAAKLGLDPAWVYGLMRSESLFAANAVSYAGALGLMQLMPATGRMMANRLGITLDGDRMLLDPVLNIKLGSAYLDHVGGQFGGNACLATAAYNAGPGNVNDWLPVARPIEADVWVEAIPFGQTRNYVRRVMAHTVVFDWRLGGSITSITDRMGMIQPLANGPATASRTAASDP
ncbi:MAG TPA: transglycosylase SLT domain-containing protein [Gammaproteobacteria bacterium]|nr:transglycosylase SLT domain-containing protein [Gammaproteobacteria bacterium]